MCVQGTQEETKCNPLLHRSCSPVRELNLLHCAKCVPGQNPLQVLRSNHFLEWMGEMDLLEYGRRSHALSVVHASIID